MSDLATLEIRVVNRLGLHARPAAMVVKEAEKYEAEIFLVKDGSRINAKSIMGVMMLAAEKGSLIVVEADGPDAEAAIQGIAAVFASKFGED